VNETKLFGESVNIYPNPVSDYMNVDFSFNKSTKVTMNIYNAVGSLVKSDSFVTERGQSTVVNTKDLSTGIYLVKFESANGSFTKKIIRN
jgi:phospholipid N-methyltransferase